MDLALAFVCLAILGIAWIYQGQVRGHEAISWGAGILAGGFLLLAARRGGQGAEGAISKRAGVLPGSPPITEAVLLSEEDTELVVWDLYGKASAVIGRDVGENQVDIDLGSGPYASMVDVEHAVLNYSADRWYVEDLGSANGIRVKKAGDARIYRISPDTPCRLEQGDCLYVGLNRLLLR